MGANRVRHDKNKKKKRHRVLHLTPQVRLKEKGLYLQMLFLLAKVRKIFQPTKKKRKKNTRKAKMPLTSC